MKKTRVYRIKLPKRSKLSIYFNPYRTAGPSNRPGKTLPVYLLLRPTKEITFSLSRSKKKRRTGTEGFRYLKQQSILPFCLLIIGFSGVVYFSKQQANVENQSIEPVRSFSVPASQMQEKKSEQGGLAPSKPTHIRIKKVGINAPVQEVGQNKDRSIEVPPLFENVTGWYKLSPTPGEIGPAVIVGHVDTYQGPSVFYSLKDLDYGDVIEITRKDKKTVKFRVTGLEQFSQDKFPSEKVYGNINHAGLRLITCGGTFNEQTQQYTANTVVFAKMVEPQK